MQDSGPPGPGLGNAALRNVLLSHFIISAVPVDQCQNRDITKKGLSQQTFGHVTVGTLQVNDDWLTVTADVC